MNNEHGITVYFHAEAPVLAGQLRTELAKRPLLASMPKGGLEEFVSTKMEERAAFYGLSHVQFDVPNEGLAGLDTLSKYLKRFF